MQNERYALETDIRGLKAQRDVLAGAAAGGVGAGAGAAGVDVLADINQQIGRLGAQLGNVTTNMAKGTWVETDSLRKVQDTLRESISPSVAPSGVAPSGIAPSSPPSETPSETPIPESAQSAEDPSLFGYGQQATPAATYASATSDFQEPEPEPEPEVVSDQAAQSQASQDLSAAYDSLLASPGVERKYGQSEATAYREAEEQRARAESAETRLDALERRESSRLSTVQADAAVGQQELAQSRQRQEQRAQKAEAKLEELNLQYAQYAQELLEKGITREDELSRQLAEERTLRGKLRDVRQDDPKIQGQKQKVKVTQQDVDEEFERIQQGLTFRAQQDLAERADRSIAEALQPSTVRKGPPRSQAQGRKKGPKRAPSGKPGD
jgi:hypothetical protein